MTPLSSIHGLLALPTPRSRSPGSLKFARSPRASRVCYVSPSCNSVDGGPQTTVSPRSRARPPRRSSIARSCSRRVTRGPPMTTVCLSPRLRAAAVSAEGYAVEQGDGRRMFAARNASLDPPRPQRPRPGGTRGTVAARLARELCVGAVGAAPSPHPSWQARHVLRVATTRGAGGSGGVRGSASGAPGRPAGPCRRCPPPRMPHPSSCRARHDGGSPRRAGPRTRRAPPWSRPKDSRIRIPTNKHTPLPAAVPPPPLVLAPFSFISKYIIYLLKYFVLKLLGAFCRF
jgi:hypothetical protein